MSMQRWGGVLSVGLTPFVALAQEPSELQAPSSSNNVSVLESIVDVLAVVPITLRSVFSGEHTWEEWHDYWSEDLSHRVDYVDHFFGDRILKDDNRDTRVMLRQGFRFYRYDNVSVESQFNVRLSLPQLQRRLQLIFDSGEDPEESKALRIYENAADASAPNTGLRYVLKEDPRMRLHFDTGIHFSRTPQLFGRMRTRYTLPLGLWQLRLQERIEALTSDGLEQTSEIIWDRQLPEKTVLRLRSALEWEDRHRGVTPVQSFTYYRIINAWSSYKTGVLASWPETPHGGKDLYAVATGYRRLLYGDWLFLEISPGIEFAAERDYAANPYIVTMLEITFQRDKPLDAANKTSFCSR